MKTTDKHQGYKNNQSLWCHWCYPILPWGMTLRFDFVYVRLYREIVYHSIINSRIRRDWLLFTTPLRLVSRAAFGVNLACDMSDSYLHYGPRILFLVVAEYSGSWERYLKFWYDWSNSWVHDTRHSRLPVWICGERRVKERKVKMSWTRSSRLEWSKRKTTGIF